jgi:mRNA degradation ribonuclease J1/J2
MPGTTRIIPLGGLGEVGKNMTVYEADGEAIVIDAGLAFPRDEHLGVDLILPDFSYLAERDSPIRAVVLTHGHEDHVGALPFLLRQVRVQEVWATRLTLGLIKSKLDEHGLMRAAELKEADPDGGPVQLGPFRVEFVRVAHSIPDSVAVLLDTPGGRILHTGDYKMDTRLSTACAPTSAGWPRSATPESTCRWATRRTPAAWRHRVGRPSARPSARSSPLEGRVWSRSLRTSIACSRRSTWPWTSAARCASSAARCART